MLVVATFVIGFALCFEISYCRRNLYLLKGLVHSSCCYKSQKCLRLKALMK